MEIGKLAIMITIANEEKKEKMVEKGKNLGFKICTGKVGTMNAEKIISAILTAAKREEGLYDSTSFKEEHSLYDAIIEALNGICRGDLGFGDIYRTVGLNFVVIRGSLNDTKKDEEWFAVCLYGTIGAPIKGFEHETIGLGINHI
jgi:hut operon positive regulator